jgi:histidinol-phosphatase (PHP family)
MTLSMHSHSGQFCSHGKGTQEEMVQQAIAAGFEVFALTEHMARDQDRDLYAEEVSKSMSSCHSAAYNLHAVSPHRPDLTDHRLG